VRALQELLGEAVLSHALRALRERLDAGIDALTYVQAHQEALSWADAPGRLHAEQALVPALDAQFQEADEQQARAPSLADAAAARLDVTTAAFHEAEGKRHVAAQEHPAALARFEQLGVPDPQEHSVAAAAAEVARLEAEQRSHAARYAEQLTAKGGQQAQLKEAETELRDADERLTSAGSLSTDCRAGCVSSYAGAAHASRSTEFFGTREERWSAVPGIRTSRASGRPPGPRPLAGAPEAAGPSATPS